MDRRSFLQMTATLAATGAFPCLALAAAEDSKNTTRNIRQIVLDLATTGLDPKQGDRVTEVAAIELCNGKVSARHFHRYLNPECEIGPCAVGMHGLTLERLQDEPKFAEVAPALLEFISGAELIIHNAPFDVGFLNKELELAGLPALGEHCPSAICTLKLARYLHPGKSNSLIALCDRYKIDNSHRIAQNKLLDTELLTEIYLVMTTDQATGGFNSEVQLL